MAENSKIQWTHHTFNPWRGCQKVSPGCQHCYAETMSKRNPGTLGIWGPNGTRVVASESQWKLPHKWNREAEAAGERRRVFCASLADVFEDIGSDYVCDTRGHAIYRAFEGAENSNDAADHYRVGLDHIRQRLFSVIDETPWLDWLLLTKRPENILRMVPLFDAEDPAEWWPNVWIGTSVENQEQANARIPELLQVPAAVRFLSMEPLLGPVDLTNVDDSTSEGVWLDCLSGVFSRDRKNSREITPDGITGDRIINWVIVGGESGPGARPCDLEWIRSIRDQCKGAGVSVFVKQLGANAVTYNPTGSYRQDTPCRLTFRDRKGGELLEWPKDLRVRELPTTEGVQR